MNNVPKKSKIEYHVMVPIVAVSPQHLERVNEQRAKKIKNRIPRDGTDRRGLTSEPARYSSQRDRNKNLPMKFW